MKCPDDFTQSELLAEISDYLQERGIAESYFGKLAVREPTVVSRLRTGRVTFRIAKRLREFIAADRRARAGSPES